MHDYTIAMYFLNYILSVLCLLGACVNRQLLPFAADPVVRVLSFDVNLQSTL